MNSSKEILTLINNNKTARWQSSIYVLCRSIQIKKLFQRWNIVNYKYFRLFVGYASGFHDQHVSVFILNPQSISSIIHSWCTDNKFAWHMAPRRPPHLKTCTNISEKIDKGVKVFRHYLFILHAQTIGCWVFLLFRSFFQ